jgi:hypothetical protein
MVEWDDLRRCSTLNEWHAATQVRLRCLAPAEANVFTPTVTIAQRLLARAKAEGRCLTSSLSKGVLMLKSK